MNTPPEEFILVSEQRLLSFARSSFEKVGLQPEHGDLIARYLVDSDLRGVRSHGTKFVNWYCESFAQGKLNPHPKIAVLSETATIATVDGDGTLGYLPTTRATELAIAKAKTNGLGLATVRRIGHYGAAGHYCRLCMEAGCIGISFQGTRHAAQVGAEGGKPQLGYIGNPPLCFAFPSGDEYPVILDAATRILPDADGDPQSNALLSQIPAAFFKSIGLVASALLFGGALPGSMLPESEAILARYEEAFRSGMVLAISVEAVVSEEAFRTEVDRLVAEVRRGYEPMPGNEEALLPGAIEEQRMARYDGCIYLTDGEAPKPTVKPPCTKAGI